MNSPSPLELSSVIVRSSEPLSADISDEIILMSVQIGKYFALDAIGSDIWRRAATPIRVADLCAGLVADYDGDPAIIERDALKLLSRMVELGVMVVTA